MDTTEWSGVVFRYRSLWPRSRFSDESAAAWFESLKPYSAGHVAEALTRLARDEDMQPSLAKVMSMASAVRRERTPAIGDGRSDVNAGVVCWEIRPVMSIAQVQHQVPLSPDQEARIRTVRTYEEALETCVRGEEFIVAILPKEDKR